MAGFEPATPRPPVWCASQAALHPDSAARFLLLDRTLLRTRGWGCRAAHLEQRRRRSRPAVGGQEIENPAEALTHFGDALPRVGAKQLHDRRLAAGILPGPSSL